MTDPQGRGTLPQPSAAVDFHIPFIAEALGNSLIYEEYKGDFALARKIAQDAFEASRAGSDLQVKADAHLALGLIQILQGDLHEARSTLAEVGRICPEDAE